MKSKWLTTSILWSMSVGSVLWAATAPQPKITSSVERASGIYQTGEVIKFNFKAIDATGKPLGNAPCLLLMAGDKTVDGMHKLKFDAQGQLQYTTKLNRPGSIRCKVWLPKTKILSWTGAVIAPEKIQPARPCPSDFNTYWNGLKKKIDATPVNAKLTPVKKMKQCKYMQVFDLELPCPMSKAPVRGYFTKPFKAAPKSLPAIVSFHGAGVYTASASYWGRNMLALDINAHGIPNGQPREFYKNMGKTTLRGYSFFGMDNRDTSYFRNMFLRVYRALQFIKSQPEWNGKTLITYGGSQGGAQALVAAGLDPQVSAVVAYVPALCDHGGINVGRHSGWPRFHYRKTYRDNPQKCAEVADYVDVVNFARNIKNAELFVTTGLIDRTCVASSVCAAYNVIPSKNKQLIFMPQIAHQIPREYSRAANKFIREHRAKNK